MAGDEVAVVWVLVLCGAAVAAWCGVQRQSAGVRRAGALLADGSGVLAAGAAGAAGSAGSAGAEGGGAAAACVRWSAGLWRPVRGAPELLLLPGGLAAGWATGSPVPVLAAVPAVLPVRRWRLRRATAVEAGHRAAAVVELCAALAGELRGGATPEQALHLVTTRLAADPVALRRIGAEPVARLAAGRFGGDVPAAFRLLAELPGGSGAAAVAACWEVSCVGGSGLAAGLDGVAEALRVERALEEEIGAELAAPRTTVAVLAALPLAGLLLGAALGARPLEVLLHTPAGLAALVAGAALEAVGLAWTGRIVRAAAEGPLGSAPVREPLREPVGRPVRESPPPAGEWRCGISRVRSRPGRPERAVRGEVGCG
ncbi:type II secretion system F family protein [Kitasatospora sp. NPDC058115]|uniref:type II secretion system F family protein n=1 Tax=Kitasatospora sp. NPDC058115 TaxID=3346347 RepID=UPI0036DCABE9